MKVNRSFQTHLETSRLAPDRKEDEGRGSKLDQRKMK